VFRPDSAENLGIWASIRISTAPDSAHNAELFSSVTFPHPGEEGRGWISQDRTFSFAVDMCRWSPTCAVWEVGRHYDFMGSQRDHDVAEVIEWIAKQPWCDGNVGMFGVSYFAWIQVFTAALNPRPSVHIRPARITDFYRDWIYRGGIFAYNFIRALAKDYNNPRFEVITQRILGEAGLKRRLMQLFWMGTSWLFGHGRRLKNIDQGINPIMADVMLNPWMWPFWEERKAKYDTTKVPAYIGATGRPTVSTCGCISRLGKTEGAQEDVIGPPMYLDRPFFQFQFEALRWFDHGSKA
jgi:hypothetical protein